MNEPQAHIYEFGDFRVDAVKRLFLRLDGEQIPLTPKVFDTLLYLVRHAGKVVEKDELMTEIWADTIVEENNLSQNISILRRILGEKRGEHRFIATIPGKGFKFVAAVASASPKSEVQSPKSSEIPDFRFQISDSFAENPDPNNEDRTLTNGGREGEKKKNLFRLWAIAGAVLVGFGLLGFYAWRENRKAVSAVKTVAVLPFKPLVAENRDEALEIGMADTLILRLGSNREVTVRPLSSVRKYGGLEQDSVQAGRDLDVDSVVDGSVQRWGDKIRVTVRLVKVADGVALWTGTFDENFTDIFVVQDAISNKVAAALALQLGGAKRHTENLEAYRLYLSGRFHLSKRTPPDLRKSIEYFEQAIALDPNYALAFAGLADAYSLLANAGSPPREMMPLAREAALKALLLDESLAEAHAALGQIIIYYDYDFAGAERQHRRAIELNPNYATAHQWYSELLTGLGRHEEALAEMRRALEIDPFSLIINRQYGVSLLFARKYDEAVAQLKKTLELDGNFALAHSSISMAYRVTGDYAGCIEELAKFQELNGEHGIAAMMRESFAGGGWQGFLRAMTGTRRPANLTPYNAATFYAELGEKDKAFAELDKSFENRESLLTLLGVDPRFDSLRDDARFIDLMRRMNFE